MITVLFFRIRQEPNRKALERLGRRKDRIKFDGMSKPKALVTDHVWVNKHLYNSNNLIQDGGWTNLHYGIFQHLFITLSVCSNKVPFTKQLVSIENTIKII